MSYAKDLAKDRDKARTQVGIFAKLLRDVLRQHDDNRAISTRTRSRAEKELAKLDREADRAEALLS